MSGRIVIVEDEMLLAMDLEDILTEAGYVVVGSAIDMAQALEIAEKAGGAIDLALMDVNLARGPNGIETAAELRRRWDIPSLFVSGNLDEFTRATAMRSHPAGFIGKPYSERELLAAVTVAFAEQKLRISSDLA